MFWPIMFFLMLFCAAMAILTPFIDEKSKSWIAWIILTLTFGMTSIYMKNGW